MLDVKFQLPALERLAKVIGYAYSGTEITDLLKKSGFATIRHDGGTKWRFLYAEFERMQRDFGAEAVLKVLLAACDPQERLNRGDVRKEINECLSFYELRIGEDGQLRKGERVGTLPDVDKQLFSQRNYHRLVVEHARAKFLQRDYFGAVSDCCKGFERFVRTKSGVELAGRSLMGKALDPKSGLVLSLPNVSEMTREDVQDGIRHMSMGIMASVRNPTAHESEYSFPIGRDNALDILCVISHLCRQIDRMVPRPTG